MLTRSKLRNTLVNRGVVAQTGVIPEGYQLFNDTYPLKVLKTENVLAESIGGKQHKVMRVTGLFQECDNINANGRMYEQSIMHQAVSDIQEDLKSRRVVGELDHPADAKIHLDRVSHLITKVWTEGKKVYGEAEILDNQPLGACLKGLLERKVQIGISSRGVGDMELSEENGREVYRVLPGYSLVTWDVVSEPSVAGAILNLCESRLRTAKRDVKAGIVSREGYEQLLVKEINKYFK